MRPEYLWTLCWANSNLASIYDFVSKSVPELRGSWPTKAWGGYEAESYSINDGLALLVVRATGGQMPYPKNAQPIPLTKPGCPVSEKLNVFKVIEWARSAFGLGPFDSAFVMPKIEVPGNQQEFEKLPEDLQKAMLAQLDFEFKRISALLRGLAQKVSPPTLVIRANTVQAVMGDYVAGDKVQGDKIVVDSSQKTTTTVTGSPGAIVQTATGGSTASVGITDVPALLKAMKNFMLEAQKANIPPYLKDDIQTWVKESMEEIGKPEKDRKPGKIEYIWAKVVGVLKQTKEAYETLSTFLKPILVAVAPELARTLQEILGKG